jgi:hypothetical protein
MQEGFPACGTKRLGTTGVTHPEKRAVSGNTKANSRM